MMEILTDQCNWREAGFEHLLQYQCLSQIYGYVRMCWPIAWYCLNLPDILIGMSTGIIKKTDIQLCFFIDADLDADMYAVTSSLTLFGADKCAGSYW